MPFMHEVKRRGRAALPPLGFLLLVGYFGWNVVNGDRGLRATTARLGVLQAAQVELAQAQQDREAWERRISGLQPRHLDPDTLDERARAMLNMADPTDVVVPYPKNKRLF